MDADIKREWVAALRSGEYKQGRNRLCHRGRMCCLGVLYDACVDGEWVNTQDGWAVPQDGDCFCYEVLSLPPIVADVVGLTIESQIRLADMNDGRRGPRRSFAEIADWIEANL